MKKKNKGFTLIELMVVVAIIGILAAVAVPRFLNFMANSRRTEARTMLSALFNVEAATFEGLSVNAAQAAASSSGYTDAFNAGFQPASPVKLYTNLNGGEPVCPPGGGACTGPTYSSHIILDFTAGGTPERGTWFNAAICGDPNLNGTADDQFNIASDGGREPVLCNDDLTESPAQGTAGAAACVTTGTAVCP